MEKKLSDELKQCLEERKCTGCDHYDIDTALACRGLLQKAYDRIKMYEDMEERKEENTERFTEKFKDGRNIIRKGIASVHHNGFGWFCDGEAVDKLAEYEDMEDQGKLLKLPCKVGDTVWYIDERLEKQGRKKVTVFFVDSGTVDNITLGGVMIPQVEVCNNTDNSWITFDKDDWNKYAFFTKEEAETALRKIKETEK